MNDDSQYYRPSQITPGIYIGPQYYRVGKANLEERGITYSIDMRVEFERSGPDFGLENHLDLPVEDDEAPTFDQFLQGMNFIETAASQGAKIYVHCAGGIGRSPTLVAAYFIRKDMTLDEALDKIRQARPIISPSPKQLKGLEEFEAEVRRGGQPTL